MTQSKAEAKLAEVLKREVNKTDKGLDAKGTPKGSG